MIHHFPTHPFDSSFKVTIWGTQSQASKLKHSLISQHLPELLEVDRTL